MRKKQRGFFLICVMTITIFLVMFAGVVTLFAEQAVRNANAVQNNARARYVALSGLEYAKTRISSVWNNSKTVWQGGNCGRPLQEININGLHVYEHYSGTGTVGWVEGTVENIPQSVFFIFFVEDPDGDGKIPPSHMKDSFFQEQINPRFKSLSNINEFENARINTSYDRKYTRKVPALTAHIIVQGRCHGAVFNAESLIVRTPPEAYNAPVICNGSYSNTLKADNGHTTVAASMNVHPEMHINGDISITTAADAVRADQSVEMREGGRALVGGNITLDSSLDPEKCGLFKVPQGNTKDRPAMPNTSYFDGSKPKYTVDSGTYVFDSVVVSGVKYDSNGDQVMDKEVEDTAIIVTVYPGNGGPPEKYNWYSGKCVELKYDEASQSYYYGETPSYPSNQQAFDRMKQAFTLNSYSKFVTGLRANNNIEVAGGGDFNIQFSPYNPIRPDLVLNDQYIKNNNGSINLQTKISGSGGVYASGNLTVAGTKSNKNGDMLLYAGGDLAIDPASSVANDYKLADAESSEKIDTDGEGYGTDYNAVQEFIQSLPGMGGRGKSMEVGDADQYVAQAIVKYWENEQEGADFWSIDSELLAGVALKICATGVTTSGSKSETGRLIDILRNDYHIEPSKTYEIVVNLLAQNSFVSVFYDSLKVDPVTGKRYYSPEANYVFDAERMEIFQKIAAGDYNGKLITLGESENIIRGSAYAGGNFRVNNVGKNTMTIEGALYAGNITVNAGNFNMVYDLSNLKAIYELGDNTFTETFRALYK